MKTWKFNRLLTSALMSAILFAGSFSIPVNAAELSSSEFENENGVEDEFFNDIIHYINDI